MTVNNFKKLLSLRAAVFCMALPCSSQAAAAVRVTFQVEKSQLKVGETTTARVMAQIVPEQLGDTTQIFSWYVDLLNSNQAAIQIQPGSVSVLTSDSHPTTSSKGTLTAGNLRAVYDTFTNTPDAGHDAPVELFSVQLKAVAVGAATFTVAPGSGAGSLEEDFIVATISGDPVFGGVYDTATATLTTFNNVPPTLDAIANVTVDEGSQISIVAAGRDADSGQTLAYTIVGTAPGGASLNAATGAFTWTPAETQGPGVYNLKIKVSDNGAPSMSATNDFTVTVREANLAPTVQPVPPRTRSELSPITLQVVASDADVVLGQTPNTNRLSYSLINPPAGAVIDPTSGAFSWTPSEGQGPGTFNLTAQVLDDGSPPLGSRITFSITVVEGNARPLITAPPDQTIPEGATMNVAFVTTDVDLPANQMTYTLLAGPPGVVLDSATGLITWSPNEAQGPSTNTIRVSVSDNTAIPLSSTNSFQVIVTEVNSPPVLNTLADRTVTERTLLSFPAPSSDSDLPGQTLTYSLDGAPPGAAISPSGVFTWTPTEAQGPGRYTIGVRVTDNGLPTHSDVKSFDVVVTEQNTAPALVTPAGQETQTIAELVQKTIQFTATDIDLPTNLISFSLENAPQGAAIDGASGLFSWTPSELQGPGVYTIRVVATDNAIIPLSTTNTVILTVSESSTAPLIDPIDDQIVDELSKLTLPVAARDNDVPVQSLTFSLDSAPPGAAIDPVSGIFTWTPTESQGPGQYDVVVRVRESGTAALFTTKTFSISVNEINARPIVQVPSLFTRSEMAPLSLAVTVTDSDILNGQSPSTNRFTFRLLSAPEGATINAQSGVVSWTPTEAQGPGSYQMRVVATDDGLPPLSGEATLTINIVEGNRTPTIVAPPNQTVAELAPLNATFIATDPDLPANTLSFTLVSGPAGVTVNPTTGGVSWTPTEAQGPGIYTIAIMVSDNGSPVLRSTNSMNITVTEVNSKPVLSGIPDFTLAVGSTINFIAAAIDSDIPVQTLVYSMDSGPAGAAINASSGVFTWTPSVAQGGQQFTITLRAAENGAGALSDTRSFKINVTGASSANTAPIILNPPNQNATVGATLTVPIVATDTDVPANTLTFALVAAPAGVTINPSTGVLTWTPTAAQIGQSQIQVKVTDNGIPPLSNTNLFTVSVTGGNATPATLRIVSVAAGGTTLRVEGPAGSNYDLEYSTDLINWTSLTTVSLDAQTFVTYLDVAHVLAQKMGFYRAKSAGGTVAPSAPTVGVQSIAPGGLTVRVTGDAGRTYRIQLSTDLIDWSPLGTVSITSGTIADFIDTAQSTRGTKAFYRAVVP